MPGDEILNEVLRDETLASDMGQERVNDLIIQRLGLVHGE